MEEEVLIIHMNIKEVQVTQIQKPVSEGGVSYPTY